MNEIKVMDENGKVITGEIINTITNNELNKTYIVYKDDKDILVSQLIKQGNSYEIKPVEDDEWDYIEQHIND